jgi:hypothetical protein
MKRAITLDNIEYVTWGILDAAIDLSKPRLLGCQDSESIIKVDGTACSQGNQLY